MTPARQILAWLGAPDLRDAALCGVGLAGLGAGLGLPLAALPGLGILGAASLAIARIDGRHQVIPDLLTLALALAAGLAPLPGPRLQTALATLVLLGAFRWAASRALGRTALGAGDVKLIAAAALWLPAEGLPAYLLCAALSGLAESVCLRRRRLAFGRHLAPWLCLLALIARLP